MRWRRTRDWGGSPTTHLLRGQLWLRLHPDFYSECVYPYTFTNSSLEEGAELPSVIRGGPMTHPHVERWNDFFKATEQIRMQAFSTIENFWNYISHTCVSLSDSTVIGLPWSRNHSMDWRVLFLPLARNQNAHTYLCLRTTVLPTGLLGEGSLFLVSKVEREWKKRK